MSCVSVRAASRFADSVHGIIATPVVLKRIVRCYDVPLLLRCSVMNQFVTIRMVAGLIETVSGANLGKECETVEFEDSRPIGRGSEISIGHVEQTQSWDSILWSRRPRRDHRIGCRKGCLRSPRSLVHIRVQPWIVPLVSEHVTYDGRRYISLQASGYNTPYSYDGRYYMRNSSSDEGVGPETISQLVMARGVDPLNGLKSDKQDLTFRLLFGMMSMWGLHPDADPDSLKALGMIDSLAGSTSPHICFRIRTGSRCKCSVSTVATGYPCPTG